ncbi:MAG: phosphoglycerate dehydrogenase [Firmicutes bacterium]|jgi:D-3-phosphoglycerate dehydrogenase|nr:phosphoglycerate dehydrogenase [Bacillota bacterium]
MAKILVTEKLAESGLDAMRAAGHEVDVQLDWTPDTLLEIIKGKDALVVRSATKVIEEVLKAGSDLKVVGRAGVGLDNVDTAAATKLGIMVVNAPESNIISAAEHAIALLLSQARNIPQAHGALVQGRWERSKWEGVELFGKTVGIVGLGRIGALVAQRLSGFGVKLVGYDPYISEDRAKKYGIELMSLEQLVQVADFVTIHLPKTKETAGLFGKELLAKVKPGIRIVNAARGGIIDEESLAEAIREGRVAGAALDVFSKEPPTDSPLLEQPSVVVTPHLGASTGEAQDKAGEQIAEQIILALAGDFVPYAVNISAKSISEQARPYLAVAEQLGHFIAGLFDKLPNELEVEYQGSLAGEEVSMLTLSVLKGVFASATEEPVSYVNAPQLASEHGLTIREVQSTATKGRTSLITVKGAGHEVSGTLGSDELPRIVSVDGHSIEVPPAPSMLVVRNNDKPGMIGVVGTILGNAGISIKNMAVGQTAGNETAMMVLSTDPVVPEQIIVALGKESGILEVHQIIS